LETQTNNVELLKLNLDTKLNTKTFDENSYIRATEKLINRVFQSITFLSIVMDGTAIGRDRLGNRIIESLSDLSAPFKLH